MAVLCVLTVTGSARPEPRGLRTLWSMPYAGDDFSIVGDMALVLLAVETAAMLTAYDADRRLDPLGRGAVAAETSHMTAAEEAGVLLLPATFTDLSTATDGTEYFAGDVNLDVRRRRRAHRRRPCGGSAATSTRRRPTPCCSPGGITDQRHGPAT